MDSDGTGRILVVRSFAASGGSWAAVKCNHKMQFFLKRMVSLSCQSTLFCVGLA